MAARGTPPTSLETDLAELRAALARLPLPARQDDILAALITRHSPVRLLWRAGNLSRTRLYTSLADICDDAVHPQAARAAAPLH